MLSNYLKMAFRNLLANKSYTVVNILGLTVGMSCCFLLLLYVQDELGYDRFHEHADEIYRVVVNARLGETEMSAALSPPPMAMALQDDFPLVVQTTRLMKASGPVLLRYEERRFNEENFAYADSTFFDVFSLELLRGNSETALSKANTVLLTKSTAKRYFDDVNPVGKILTTADGESFEVSGVLRDIPANSHFQFDFLASISTLRYSRNPFWISFNLYTYIRLEPGSDPALLEAEFPAVVSKYAGPQIMAAMGISYEKFQSSGNHIGFSLQPLTDIHLNSDLDAEFQPNGVKTYVYIFAIAAFLILLVAAINFVNLSTARSAQRAKEVGIRKVLGSNRQQLIRQFLAESLLLTAVGVICALTVVELVLPDFNFLAGKEIAVGYFSSPWVLPGILLVTLFVGLLAGSYPAFFLASFQPGSVLKGKLRMGVKSGWLRNALVVVQIAVSIVLFVGTIVLHHQLEYMSAKRLGFNKEHVVVVKRPAALGEMRETWKNEITAHTQIVSASTTTSLPGKQFAISSFQTETMTEEETFTFRVLGCDADFLNTFDVTLQNGRFFDPDRPADQQAVLINETAAATLGWNAETAIGKQIFHAGTSRESNTSFEVIGVVKDFHFESLHQQIRPVMLSQGELQGWQYISVRILPGNIETAINFIQSKWAAFLPDQPFDFFFFDAEYDKLYQAEERTGDMFNRFAWFAAFIACLGLLGLASFIIRQRTKEIGMRKVLGASVGDILMLLGREFVKLIIIAAVIASPIAYYLMNNWLQDFVYRIELGPWPFILGGLLVMGISLLTVSFQVIKAARTNPIDTIQYE